MINLKKCADQLNAYVDETKKLGKFSSADGIVRERKETLQWMIVGIRMTGLKVSVKDGLYEVKE